MTEMNTARTRRQFKAPHRGRGAQVSIYLGKLLRMFLYQNDWKVLPMAALIAGLVGMVIRKKMFLNMEGTIMGSFALVCVCIWNGCFNSIQVICRERDVIKREHRSGMHISSYICAHMIYQLLLCALQTGVTLYILQMVGVQFGEATPMFTRWFIVDLGISMLLITFASDMLSLWVSTLAHTTTTAMTIMPFVLIFQLVFSGGMLTLPAWTEPLTHFTISNPGLKVVAAQANTNERPFVTISNMLAKMKDEKIERQIKLGDVLDLLSDEKKPSIKALREREISGKVTGAQLKELLDKPGTDAQKGDDLPGKGAIVDAAMDLLENKGIWDLIKDRTFEMHTTVGEVIDLIGKMPDVKARREEMIPFTAKVGDLLDIVGEDKAMAFLEEKAGKASYKKAYDYTRDNVSSYWLHLVAFIVVFGMLATITLEFVDKDKR